MNAASGHYCRKFGAHKADKGGASGITSVLRTQRTGTSGDAPCGDYACPELRGSGGQKEVEKRPVNDRAGAINPGPAFIVR